MSQERMIAVTDMGILESGAVANPNRYALVPVKRTEKTVEEQNREKVIWGLKVGVPVWGSLSIVSVSFWGFLAYWLLL